tara:strand:- start:221 stop:1120 length:900 start_codon:yes stop_codon:yes gene_type:complete
MKVLITGFNGQLGQALIKANQTEKLDIISLSRNEMNFLNPESIKRNIKLYKPDWIINAAAYTEVDKAESEPEIATAVNYYGTKTIAEELKCSGGKLLQISTDFVFSGDQGKPYETSSKRNPIGIYGKSKAKAEEIIEKILLPSSQGKILRTSWVMGPVRKNFALTMLKLHQSRSEIRVVCDQIGCPTSTHDLSMACWQLIKKDEKNIPIPDILHWSDAGAASWYDVAVAVGEIGEQIGLIRRSAKIKPIMTSEYVTAAKRPHFSLLNCSKTESIIDIERSHWRANLRKILINYSNINKN